MRRWVGSFVLLAALCVTQSCDGSDSGVRASQAATSTAASSRLLEGEGFTVRLPGREPRRTVQDRSAGGQSYQMIRYEVEPSKSELLAVAVAEYPVDLEDLLADDPAGSAPSPGGLTFEDFLESAARGGGAVLEDHWADVVDGIPARTGRLSVDRDGYEGSGFVTVVIKGRTLFQIIDVVDGGDGPNRPSAAYDDVIDSVSLD